MSRLPQNIRESLLSSGKDLFLAYGFENASLRTICKNAGLTTGAFYSHFSGKEDLFSSLVEPLIHGFQKMYQDVMSQDLADLTTDAEHELTSITYVLEHKDEFRLLFECSKGTKYEGFKEHLIHEVFYPAYQEAFDRYAGRHVDPALVMIILHMKFAEYRELIYGGYTLEEVKKLVTQLTVFSEAGFHKLLEEVNQVKNSGAHADL